MDDSTRVFLCYLVNSTEANEELQVVEYNMLNVHSYQPTGGELAAICLARMNGIHLANELLDSWLKGQ